jgi:hypothetical protein
VGYREKVRETRKSAQKARRGGFAATWRGALRMRGAAGLLLMNQQLSYGLKIFSTRETQKNCFTALKMWLFLRPPLRVFEKKIERLIFGWKFFF